MNTRADTETGTPKPSRLRRLLWLLRAAVLVSVIAATIALTLIFLVAFRARSMPPLQPWHRDTPAGEFRADDATRITTLADYLALEDKLFADLKRFDIPAEQAADKPWAARYIAGHRMNPATHDVNWNRTTILRPDGPHRGVALLLHGATDSPFSFNALAGPLQRQGWMVVCLRLPGHGTTPAALADIDWRDWQAAVHLAARDLRATAITKDTPFIVGGFSLGGALALRLSLDALDDPTLPTPDALFLFSPAIGVSPAARLAEAALLPTFLPYFEKARWLGIAPEFDPYKYNSFPKRAGFDVWALTARNLRDLDALADRGGLSSLPPVTAFISVVDTTVDNRLLLRVLQRIPDNGSDITIFDINRRPRLEPFFTMDVDVGPRLLNQPAPLPYTLTLVTNATTQTDTLITRTRPAKSADITDAPTTLAWPPGIISLSHSAIPFSPADPIYGMETADGAAADTIGTMVIRSERGALALGAESLMRMRFNPFYAIVERRVLERLPTTPR